jgi:MFS transporter, FHS family, L-fucose permease
MAIVGGALIPLVMGGISDASTINLAMLVPAVCFVVVTWFALKSRGEGTAGA